ncbi:unnamed protein product [Adineta steineri]|uniref:Radial spoke head 1-like protein n=1 Tax=Adineta steineri TaxID=433720 RepID=A0A818G079_9BILA|nr:unnamed protein product [Adineta steineri]
MSDDEEEIGEEENENNLGTYEGDRNELNERHGFGKATLPNGDTFEGQYENGKRSGTGTYRFTNTARYIGEYQKNKRHGKGIFYYPDGSKYDGDWNENIREGQGTYTYPNNDTYEGEWKNHQRHGKGTYTYAATKAQYVGTWKEGKRQGPGQLHFNQYRYVGKFNDNYPKGKGRFVFKNGYQQNGEYHITSIADEEDSEAPPQIQYKWIARNVSATQQDEPYDQDDERTESRTQDQDGHHKTHGAADGDNPDEFNAEGGEGADGNEDDENQQANDDIPGEEQFDEEG